MVESGDCSVLDYNRVNASLFDDKELGRNVGVSGDDVTFAQSVKGVSSNSPLGSYLEVMKFIKWNRSFSKRFLDSFGDERYSTEMLVLRNMGGVVKNAFFRELESRVA